MGDIKKITIESEEYPVSLKEIKNPPKVLYYKGIIKKEELCFAIVGTRQCSSYGRQAAFDIAGRLTEAGVTIVSGLAPGIDTSAHLSAVSKNKRTIAVLGTGLDERNIYPKENINLSRRILEANGCLISEYPPETRGTRFTFPQRNRIISGLSKGVLVIESNETGGSMITASHALSQKRKLFAMPGSIYSYNSKGTHKLIKYGAKLFDNISDIMKELDSLPKYPLLIEKNLVLNLLEKEPLHIDKIAEITKFKAAAVSNIISILETEGKIKNLSNNTYIRCNN